MARSFNDLDMTIVVDWDISHKLKNKSPHPAGKFDNAMCKYFSQPVPIPSSMENRVDPDQMTSLQAISDLNLHSFLKRI